MSAGLVLSAHIGYLFADLPLERRPAAAAAAGFGAIEHPQPHVIPATRMARLLSDHGLAFAQMAVGAGDAAAGEKGLAALPGRRDDFLSDLERGLDYAEAVGCPFIHPMSGIVAGDPGAAAETYDRNIEAAVDACRGRPVHVLIEAISEVAIPGYFMSRLEAALTCARQYPQDSVSLLLDTFHAACNGEDASAFVEAHPGRIGHIHIADHPGRHEPGTGRLDFRALLSTLHRSGYGGHIGFEYIPAGSSRGHLSWLGDWERMTQFPGTPPETGASA